MSGSAPGAGSPRPACGTPRSPSSTRVAEEDAERTAIATLPETPDEPLLPVAASPAGGNGGPAAQRKAGRVRREDRHRPQPDEGAGLTFDDPSMDWSRDDDPFADLGPVDPEGTDDPKPRGAGGPSRRR